MSVTRWRTIPASSRAILEAIEAQQRSDDARSWWTRLRTARVSDDQRAADAARTFCMLVRRAARDHPRWRSEPIITLDDAARAAQFPDMESAVWSAVRTSLLSVPRPALA